MQTLDLHETTGILPAPIYDELRRRIDAAGGVGYGTGYRTPRCIGDFAAAIDGLTLGSAYSIEKGDFSPTVKALQTALGMSFGSHNDAAVLAVNHAKGNSASPSTLPRISFDELVAELGFRREVKIPQAVYDALEASAEEYGGIGAESFYVNDGEAIVPLCVLGHLQECDDYATLDSQLRDALGQQTGSRSIINPNDLAVQAINRRKHKPSNVRVSFAEWTRELGYVRGDA